MGGGLISQKGNATGRPYVLILLLTFGAALFGVLVLHKLRERHIFNLLIDDKNRELLSLQLMLQKEREHNKEMGRKAEEKKTKIYYLRNQKLELDHRLLELLSKINPFKGEKTAMESILEEKQNQINLLRDKDINENPHIIALIATLKQKEAQIDELKYYLTSRLGTHSNLQQNLTIIERKGKNKFSHEEGSRLHESSYKRNENGMDGNDTRSSFSHEEEKRAGFEDGREKRGVRLQNHENLKDSEDKGNYKIYGEKNHDNAIDIINDVDEEEQ